MLPIISALIALDAIRAALDTVEAFRSGSYAVAAFHAAGTVALAWISYYVGFGGLRRDILDDR